MATTKRTDLAAEAREIWQESAGVQTALSGVMAYDKKCGGVNVTVVKILDEEGEKALCKPRGVYTTIAVEPYIRRDENGFLNCAKTIAGELRQVLPEGRDKTVLVVGLGNAAITPDAVGPDTVDYIMVTRHLKGNFPEEFAMFRPVSAVKSGVLGTTGIESADVIKALAEYTSPDLVIAVDALTSRSIDRICKTVQIADTGIVPGSGIGGGRAALNRETIGVPVIAVGVPTVVDAGTLAADIAERAGKNGVSYEEISAYGGDMIVTPKDIDANVRDISKLIGYGINLALHEGITLEDIDMFIS